ncbi:hypothetical protein M1555_05025 [Patescibacteria group bacterium]|nr:hypothetical protein [Patescibacteria group bacterium]
MHHDTVTPFPFDEAVIDAINSALVRLPDIAAQILGFPKESIPSVAIDETARPTDSDELQVQKKLYLHRVLREALVGDEPIGLETAEIHLHPETIHHALLDAWQKTGGDTSLTRQTTVYLGIFVAVNGFLSQVVPEGSFEAVDHEIASALYTVWEKAVNPSD